MCLQQTKSAMVDQQGSIKTFVDQSISMKHYIFGQVLPDAAIKIKNATYVIAYEYLIQSSKSSKMVFKADFQLFSNKTSNLTY